ncbi:hypothetical protein HDU98_007751 [Podochytrium sp. JEL0797]|nr:hypothetical protein HDU98_007751 [Podochytrium sp. JEL0797]
MKKSKNRAILPQKFKKRSAADMTSTFAARGPCEPSAGGAPSLAREQSLAAKRHKGVSQSRDRTTTGLRNATQKAESQKVLEFAQRPMNYNAKASESDRKVMTKMPKHLFSGKRGSGTRSGTASHR